MRIFDGHNDCLLRLFQNSNPDKADLFFTQQSAGHIDLPRLQRGGFCGGFFAVYVPADPHASGSKKSEPNSDNTPLPAPLDPDYARRVTIAMSSILLQLIEQSEQQLALVTSRATLDAALAHDRIAVIFHVEGAEAIDADLAFLDVLYAAGLRSLGPVWSRPNIFAQGVPFRYPSSPDIGEGLTDAGMRLIKACNRKKILVDLSHLNEKGFWDVARLSDAPLVATHSNAHALCLQSRNLTDKQLDCIRERQGMVGVNFATAFLRADGQRNARTPLTDIVRHVDYLITRLGEDKVGFGSDFDGAMIPEELGDVAGLPRLVAALRAHGYNDALIEKLCYKNWVDVIGRTLG
ncbi:MAG: membrane dipeptidase [Methylocystaceae bacterium]|nr:membrane dipeptidase [Methylocystaceae bacterium]